MAQKYFKNQFAISGDTEAVPDDSVNTLVSYETGYTPEYELDPDVDPNGNYIGRPRMNQLFKDITGNLKQWQDKGYPEFVADDGTGSPLSYTVGRIVELSGVYYRANTTTTTAPPSAEWDVETFSDATGLIGVQVISATGLFTPTAGARTFHVFATGAGAGSGGADAADADSEAIGGSAGAGATAEKVFTLAEMGANAAVTIGAAGVGGAAGANDGTDGGTTTFIPAGTGPTLTAGGGKKGLGVSTATLKEGAAGIGGIATGGDINRSGGSGNSGNGGADNAKFLVSGPGGTSYWGPGGNSQNLTAAGNLDGLPGVNPGSGASGGIEINATAPAGADGADGIVVVYEFA